MRGVHQSAKGKVKAPEAVAGFSGDVFDTEYGDRGSHKVTVSIRSSGIAGYSITWRDGKKEQGTTGGLTRTRTITGGFPLAQVGIQGLGVATCTITVDGAQKATKSTSRKYAIAICNG
jgi:hypothetical protein